MIHTHVDADRDTLEIFVAAAQSEAAYVHTPQRPATVTKEDAPLVALKLLEASGWTQDSLGGPVEHALKGLAKHIQNVAAAEEAARKEAEEEEARKAAQEEARKAEEAAALDAEALALLNAYRLTNGRPARKSLDEITDARSRDGWRLIAREARKMHAQPEPEAAPEPPARFTVAQSQKRPHHWLLLDGERPDKAAAFWSEADAQRGLVNAQNGITYFFEPLSNHF